MDVAFIVGGLYTEGSGVARIVSELANALVSCGTRLDVFTAVCGSDGATDHMLESGVGLRAMPGSGPRRLGWSRSLRRLLEREAGDYAVLHNHSLWMLPNHYACVAARRHRRPVVFTVHGFLESWALRRARLKKRVAAWWFQDRDFRGAACLHVNSESEIRSVRAYGLPNPIAVVPNGVSSGFLARSHEPGLFREAFPDLSDRRVCLFLSRLHEKKGVLPLLEAWSGLHRDLPDWQLVLAGPDDGLGDRVQSRIRDLGLHDQVTVTGPLFGELKHSALDAAEAFVLPSYSEGFSMALLDALGRRLPVLCTPGCNFPEIRDNGAGIEVEPHVSGIGEGLREILGGSEADRRRMGEAGRRMVEENYTWDHVASQMLTLYAWLDGTGVRPDFVVD